MRGALLRTLRNIRVVKETLLANSMASGKSNATAATVALALRELSFTHGDQESLSEFLRDYFASDDHECNSGKYN